MYDRNVTPDVVCYNLMIDGLLKGGEFDKGMSMWEWEKLVLDGQVAPNVSTYNAMMNDLCRLGRFEKM